MSRLPDQHLNLYEVTLLASDKLSGGTRLSALNTQREELRQHLQLCQECREWLEQEQALILMFKHSPKRNLTDPDIECPSEQEWMELAAGFGPSIETQRYLEHALECAPCASRLKQACEAFADEATEEEQKFLSSLQSADPEWQKRLAKRMQIQSRSAALARFGHKAHNNAPFPRFAIAACSAAFLLLTLAWLTYLRPSVTVNRLLSTAYSDQRTSDLRLAQSRYASIQVFRGGSPAELRRPTALLEAQVLIAKELASKPDDPFWLGVQGRADLLEQNYSSAISALEHAYRYASESNAIRLDLANAYFLRAEALKRPEDYGRAVDLLGQVLRQDPHNEIALFNRAIASERLLLYDQAVDDWHRYLALDPASPWSAEARQRLEKLEERIRLHRNKSERPLLVPNELVALIRHNREAAAQEFDSRIERYFEIALAEWLPSSFSSAQQSDTVAARLALDELAEVLASKHADYWFSDFLQRLRSHRQPAPGLSELVDSVRTSQTSDLDHARRAAAEATLLFRRSGNQPGQLLAEFESSYADQLAHQVASCRDEASARSDPRVASRYPWLLTQFSLESAICLDLNDEAARKLASQAAKVAESHGFPALELRALTFLAFLYQYMGDPSSAWNYASEGLSRYWDGDYTLMRGYSLYNGIDLLAEDAQQWHLDAEILKEATRFIAYDSDLQMRAMAQYRLANALEMTGDFEGAERSLLDARALFSRSAEGSRKNALECEAQIGLAKLDLLRSDPASAIERSERLRTQINLLSDKDLLFDFYRNLGLAYFARGAAVEAGQDLGHALALAEESLPANHDERERLIWSRKADAVYRTMVQLKTAGPPREAFALWEWFKGASLRRVPVRGYHPVPETPSLPLPSDSSSYFVPADTIVASYAVLPQGVFAWTYRPEGVQQFRLQASSKDLEFLSRRFADHCARPDSDPATLAADARILYRKLFEPLEPVLRPYKHVIVEPDQALWLVPFEALIEANGGYLGDRYAVSVSPGLAYLAAAHTWRGIGAGSHILIAADPVTPGTMPLSDAEEEAKGIAAQFRYSQLLLQGDAGFAEIASRMPDTDIFHFSGHAAASPDGVGLLLGDSEVINVAKIHVAELSGLKLAVLSACNSANGADGVFDDRNSLARLLAGAGVPEIVASRWMVDSRATAALMRSFYAQLVRGQDVSEALREAARKLRNDPQFGHPFYWAAFSAFGKS